MSIKKFTLLGGAMGFLVIFYDFDFLLNPGGPNTPISDAIVKFLFPGKFICCWEAFEVASLSMIFIGALSVFLISALVSFLKSSK